MEKINSVDVTVTRYFTASPDRVFDAWLDEKVIGTWMFGPNVRDEKIVQLQMDAHVGGKFSFLVQRGDNKIEHLGYYREMERPCRLVFTWGVAGDSENESEVRLDFAPHGKGCELILTHAMDKKWAEYVDRTKAAWTKMLEALAKAFHE